jgi:molecular chaperone HtpG
MARLVSEIENKPKIGRQIFDIVTSGMYDNPLMIYREYIQNSVDSIDDAVENGLLELEQERISITLNGHERSIVIEDNGLGLPNATAHSVLTNLGCSPKEGKNQRGFRGVGRLGGLAYCDELVFETRSAAGEDVAVVRWNRKEFDALASDSQKDITLQEMIQAVASLDFAKASDETSDHFFRVTLHNVHRFHSDMLMNLKSVYDYLAQTAPVSYNRQVFSYAEEIETYLSKINDYHCYHIKVNERHVFRPYLDEIKLSTNSSDRINGIEYFHFVGNDSEPIALGWYARTGFLATLPSALNVKGIRVRQGNIEVGGEHFLDDKFSETRFSGWQIGEIHMVNGALKPNARRDGFEHSPQFERFLEQSHILGRHLSSLCRKSSNTRIVHAKIHALLNQLEKLFDYPSTYVDEEHYEQAINDARSTLCNIEMNVSNLTKQLEKRLENVKNKIKSHNHKPTLLEQVLDGRRLKNYDRKSLLKHIAKTIIANYKNSNSPEEILQQIFSDFTKPTYANHKLNGTSCLLR